LFIGGDAKIAHGGKWTTLKPFHAYLLPMNRVYQLRGGKQFEKFFVHFRYEVLPGKDFFDQVEAPLPLELPIADWKRVGLSGVDSLLEVMALKVKVEEVLWRFVQKFSSHRTISQKEFLIAEKYKRIYEAAEGTAWKDLDLKALAVGYGKSLPSLSRSFKLDTGDTLLSYFRSRMVVKAQEKLILTDHSIRQIAYQLGFDDEKHFSRLFRQVVRHSPRDFRQKNAPVKSVQ
jgi:AraC-like DNA-binding protein